MFSQLLSCQFFTYLLNEHTIPARETDLFSVMLPVACSGQHLIRILFQHVQVPGLTVNLSQKRKRRFL